APLQGQGVAHVAGEDDAALPRSGERQRLLQRHLASAEERQRIATPGQLEGDLPAQTGTGAADHRHARVLAHGALLHIRQQSISVPGVPPRQPRLAPRAAAGATHSGPIALYSGAVALYRGALATCSGAVALYSRRVAMCSRAVALYSRRVALCSRAVVHRNDPAVRCKGSPVQCNDLLVHRIYLLVSCVGSGGRRNDPSPRCKRAVATREAGVGRCRGRGATRRLPRRQLAGGLASPASSEVGSALSSASIFSYFAGILPADPE